MYDSVVDEVKELLRKQDTPKPNNMYSRGFHTGYEEAIYDVLEILEEAEEAYYRGDNY